MTRPAHLPPSLRLARWLAGLCAIFIIFAAGHAPADEPNEGTEEEAASTEPVAVVRVVASRYDGMPTPGVRFRVVLDATEPEYIKTDARGLLRIPLPREGVNALVTLADDEWVTDNPRQRATNDTRPLIFPIFPADATSLEGEERIAYAQAWWRVQVAQLETASLRNPEQRQMTPALRRVAFLNGMRRESPEQMLTTHENAEEEDGLTTVRVRLIDLSGNPVSGERIDLYTFRDDEVAVRLNAYSRTNNEGIALFPNIEIGALVRAHRFSRDGRVARSGFLTTRRASEDTPPLDLIMHSDSESLSGIVVDENGEPARRVMVEIMRGNDRPLMRRLVDEHGYFSFAPVPQGDDVRVRFTATGTNGNSQLVLPAQPRDREWVVPTHLFAERGN